MSNRYVVKGNGDRWTVTIKQMAPVEVVQMQPGVPLLAKEMSCPFRRNWFAVHCLTCGEEIIVDKDTAPICPTCRE